ncbi:MAG: diaminopimelate decarboxylase [Candidatus Omnitrophica bacterium]|nr:diaminopimelate decarboxylase [Candidatus Omnitrophota bacterium]
MHYFQYKNNELYCEDVRVSDIVENIGSPCYVYSYRTLIEHFRKLKSAFRGVKPLICYSVKANSNLTICKALVNEGAGLDVVSGGELYRALKIKTDPRKIVFAGVGKIDKEIKSAIKAGILFFNVESEAELERIHELSIKLRKTVNVCLRINPEVDPHTHRYIKTAKRESKFGLSFSAARQVILNRRRYFNVHIKGLHIHIGSQITETRPYVQAIKKVKAFMKEVSNFGVEFEYLNIGGGMGIVYKKEPIQTARIFARAIMPLFKNTGLRIILEPGRFIVGSAGILASRVTFVKKTELKNFLIVDSGMSELIRPSLYDAYHQILPLHKRSHSKQKKYDIVGPLCESGDFLAKDRLMPQINAGEYLAVMCSGAYGFTMSSNYNSRPRAAEVLVRGNQYFLIRKRESYLNLIKREKFPWFM